MRRPLAVAVVAAGVLLAGWLLWPKKPRSDEDLVREAIAEMARLAGAKDISGVVEHVSERYRGEGGDRQELKRFLFALTRQADWLAALPTKIEIELKGDQAHATFVVVLAKGPARTAAEVTPEASAGSYAIEADFAREDRWRVVTARRREATPSDWMR